MHEFLYRLYYKVIMEKIIFAPATAIGLSAISIIRVSGIGCKIILEILINGNVPKEKVLSLRSFYFPNKKKVIDKCLVCWMSKKNSYTGEDSFEIQCHGGIAVMNGFFEALFTFENVRFAEQGEFTKRAIINGKMNLIDAEAVNDLIQSETEEQRALAIKQLNEGLSIPIKRWRGLLVKSMANIEANIDFSDEGDVAENKISKTSLTKLSKELKETIEISREHEIIKDGVRIVLTGKTNAGKSSLFNRIIKNEKSIVTDIPGTTRDIIEAKINIKGYSVTIIDTAGINKTKDIIEKEGIKRAKDQIKKADLVLNVIDSLKFREEDKKLNHWNIFNKVDKLNQFKLLENRGVRSFKVSAKSGEGINELLEQIYNHIRFNTKKIRNANFFYSNQRQRKELEEASLFIEKAVNENQEEITAEYLRMANRGLGRILGEVDIEEVLGDIFSSFCIGK